MYINIYRINNFLGVLLSIIGSKNNRNQLVLERIAEFLELSK